MRHPHYSIAILTNSVGSSLTELTTLAKAHGVTCEAVRFPYTPLSDLATSPLIATLCNYDVVYYRTGMRDTIIAELAHLLKERHIPIINAGTKHPQLHKKIQQALIASRYQIPQPRSLYHTQFNYEVVAEQLGHTFVIKPDVGSQGTGVSLIHNAAELAAFQACTTKHQYLYQEYIHGADEYRVYTIGGKGIAVYKKILGEYDFRANLHVGGSMETVELSQKDRLLEFAGRIATAFGADISGIDILVKDDQLLFLELNWQPGWKELQQLTGCDFVHATIQFLLDRAHASKAETATD